MAISTNGSAVTGAQTNGLAALTISVTVSAGTNSCLVVAAGVDASADRNPTATYNGASMTLVAEALGGASAQGVALFRTLNPTTGTHNVVISTDFANANDHIVGIVQNFDGVDQTTPFSNPTSTTSGTATSISLNVTSSAGNLVVDAGNFNSQAATTDFACGGSQSTIGEVVSDGTSNGTGMGMSTQAGSGTTTMSWTFVSSSRNGQAAASMNAAAGGATVTYPQLERFSHRGAFRGMLH